ncbi:MAG: hypothetical protein DRP79_08080, partial [Planctomycetota bacterium]
DLLLTPGAVEPGEPAVCIEAGEADLFQHVRRTGKEDAFYFRVRMRDGVSVEAAQRTTLVVSSNEMHYWQDLEEIHADGLVTIHDADSRLLHLTGTGMDGLLDFRSITIRKSPVAYLVGGALGEGRPSRAESSPLPDVTRVTCGGPVTVRRFERPHYIRKFLVEMKTLKSFGLDEQSAVELLAELQTRMLEEDIKQEDRAGILRVAGEIIEDMAVSQGRELLETGAGDALVRSLYFMRYVSPNLDMEEMAFLRDLEKKLNDKDLDLGTGEGAASLTIITFDKDVVTATRPDTADLSALARKRGVAHDFKPPFVDSVQKCDRMVVYCREQATGEGSAAGAGIEPVKVEMRGGEGPVVIKSYGPRKATRKSLTLLQSARHAAVYTGRRAGAGRPGREEGKIVRKRLVLDGDVYIRRLGEPGEREEDRPAANTLYEAWGDKLEWNRETGNGRLSGAPGVRPTLTYSGTPVFAPVSSNGDRRVSASTVSASAADAIAFSQSDKDGPISARLLKDVVIERNEVTVDGEKRRDSLTAAGWVEMAFHRDALGRNKPAQTIFSSLDYLRALGRVNLKTADGQAWGDYLVHEGRKHEGRDVEMTILYKISEQNRGRLLGERPFTPCNWPLRAVMSSAGASDFLGVLPGRDSQGSRLQTYTVVCDGEIRYMRYPKNAPLAGKTIFLKNVKVTRSESGSRSDTTLEAAERVEMEFVRAARAGDDPDKSAVSASRLFAKGQVHLSEPVEEVGALKMREAAADTLTWRRLDAKDAARAGDRVVLEGAGTTAPEVRYTVTQKVKIKKDGRVVDTATEEERTVINCSADGGSITVFRLQAPGQGKMEDNYVLAKKEAHVRRTGATIDSSGRRKVDAPWDLRAGKVTTYYIPSTEGGMSSRVKKIIAEGNVVATSNRMTATGARGEWERIYRADIIERTTLFAAKGGTARVRLLGKDRRGRPVVTKMRCADRIVFERTIFDELVSPKIAARARATLTNTVRVDHLGYADRDEKLNRDITLTCDRLDVGFADILREKGKGAEEGRLDVERMTATGNAKYQVFELLKKEHKYPDHLVLTSEGRGGYIEYNKPGSGSMVGRMRGKRDERGRYIEEAVRTVYRYDRDT